MAINEASLPDTVYPIAAQNGQPIPLSVARPITGLYSTLSTTLDVTLQNTKFNIISVCSTTYTELSSVADLKVGEPTPIPITFILIPNMIYELNVYKNNTFTNLENTGGHIILNQITRWDQLTNIGAYGSTR